MNQSIKNTSSPKRKKKTRDELNAQARERKQQKKHSGHDSGARNQVVSKNKPARSQVLGKDPRIGSKVPIPLIVENKIDTKPMVAKPATKPRLTPEEELSKLENDERLDALLERLDNNDVLDKEDQTYVESMLDRIDALMTQLGIELDDEDDEKEEKQQDIIQLLKQGNPKDTF